MAKKSSNPVDAFRELWSSDWPGSTLIILRQAAAGERAEEGARACPCPVSLSLSMGYRTGRAANRFGRLRR